MSKTDEFEWTEVRLLAQRVEKGEPLILTDEVLTDIRRVAHDMAIAEDEVESGLRNVEAAKVLLREIARRITEGSHRLGHVMSSVKEFRKSGDFEGARRQWREVLAVEVVPLYRSIAEGELKRVDRWEAEAKKTPSPGS
jgi:DUSAM domain-containing protein